MQRPPSRMPHLDVVLRTVDTLQKHAMVTALGGSGLLAALGLTDRVRDWDLTTDAEPDRVAAALSAAGLVHDPAPAGDGGFTTRARFRVEGGDHEVDVIVGFGFRDQAATIALPTRVTGYWQGLPLGDPVVWAQAYRLMGRTERVAALQTWLDRAQAGDQVGGASGRTTDSREPFGGVGTGRW